MATINKLIKENKDIILNTEKNYQKQKKHLTEDEFPRYLESIQHTIYQAINESLNAFDYEKTTITEKDILKTQLPKLSTLFFDFLDSENEGYWSLYEEQIWEYFNYEYTFIEPKNFTKKYVEFRIKNLGANSQNDKISGIKKRDRKKTFDFWVELAVKMATNEVMKSYEKNNGEWKKIANDLFGDKYDNESEPLKLNSIRNYISQSHSTNNRGLWKVKNKTEILEKAVSIIKANPNLKIENSEFSQNLKKYFIKH